MRGRNIYRDRIKTFGCLVKIRSGTYADGWGWFRYEPILQRVRVRFA